jgi:hypothetical protein
VTGTATDPATVASAALGSSALGSTALGETALGSSALGSSALGSTGPAASMLASTGSDALTFGSIAALLAMLGTVLLFGAANRERRHHSR